MVVQTKSQMDWILTQMNNTTWYTASQRAKKCNLYLEYYLICIYWFQEHVIHLTHPHYITFTSWQAKTKPHLDYLSFSCPFWTLTTILVLHAYKKTRGFAKGQILCRSNQCGLSGGWRWMRREWALFGLLSYLLWLWACVLPRMLRVGAVEVQWYSTWVTQIQTLARFWMGLDSWGHLLSVVSSTGM